jgi:hypothetical protein
MVLPRFWCGSVPQKEHTRNNVARQYVARLIFTFDVDFWKLADLLAKTGRRSCEGRPGLACGGWVMQCAEPSQGHP